LGAAVQQLNLFRHLEVDPHPLTHCFATAD
jgi:hypothetical protein